MKKRISICTFVLMCASVFWGCSNKLYTYTQNNIAEVRYNIYSGHSENIKATFMSGMREKDYVINGYATSLIPFGIITFTLDTPLNSDDIATYSLQYGTTNYQGLLELNPFDNTLVADIRTIIDDCNSLQVEISANNLSQKLTLTKQNTNWKINHNQALKSATKYCKSKLKEYVSNNVFVGEVYIKIISNENKEYFWYVSFLSRNGKTTAVLINPDTGKVQASNI